MPNGRSTVRPGRRLVAEFSLSPIEQDILLLAVAPEIDLKYETLFAYLNNDITRKWPTFDLALRIGAAVAEAKNRGAPLPVAGSEALQQRTAATDQLGWRSALVARPRVFPRRRRSASISADAASLDPRLASFVEQRTASIDWQRLSIAADLRKRVALTSRVATSTRDHRLAGGHSCRSPGRRARLRRRKRCAGSWAYRHCCASTSMASVRAGENLGQLTRALLLQQRLHGAGLYLGAIRISIR